MIATSPPFAPEPEEEPLEMRLYKERLRQKLSQAVKQCHGGEMGEDY